MLYKYIYFIIITISIYFKIYFRYQWAEAIYTFLPSVPTHYIYQFANTKDIIDDSKIVITTYDLLVRAVDTFQCKIFGFVILVCYKYLIHIVI